MNRNEKIDLLENFSTFLAANGYMDDDWRSEPPYAIDRFLALTEEPTVLKFNGKPCKNGCNCIEIAESLNNGEPIKHGYPCLEPTQEKVDKLKSVILDFDTEEVLKKLKNEGRI